MKMVSLWEMRKVETIEEFYTRKFTSIPDNIKNNIGHFNVLKLDGFVGKDAKPVPYSRRDYFKIMLATGNYIMHYADETVEIKRQALTFSNPYIPYKCEQQEGITSGIFCIFTPSFFHQFGNLNNYAMFCPGGKKIFELTNEQLLQLQAVYTQMQAELNTDSIHKYDVLRTLVYQLIHFAIKLQPDVSGSKQPNNAASRIAYLFAELLERQFPIDDDHKYLLLRTASDYAKQLNVHVNHLNKAIKQTTDKTTSQIIAERTLQESKILLKHSTWSVSEIAFSLGFTEVTHFNNFFKKHMQISPLKFRVV